MLTTPLGLVSVFDHNRWTIRPSDVVEQLRDIAVTNDKDGIGILHISDLY